MIVSVYVAPNKPSKLSFRYFFSANFYNALPTFFLKVFLLKVLLLRLITGRFLENLLVFLILLAIFILKLRIKSAILELFFHIYTN